MEKDPTQIIPEQNPIPPATDVEKVIVKLSKDIDYLKNKVVELESEKLAKHFQLTPEEVKAQFMDPVPTKVSLGRGSRPILESEIKEALEHVQCASAVARYLGISYKTYRKYATRYGLFKANRHGVGALTKVPGVNKGKYPLDKCLTGEIYHPVPWRFKNLLLRSDVRKPCCERCGWKETRPDGILPLVINFIDGDQKNQKSENVRIYCYNCTFVLRGYIRRGVLVFDEVSKM